MRILLKFKSMPIIISQNQKINMEINAHRLKKITETTIYISRIKYIFMQ